jgi:phosphoribosyl 1,2-cyclic phosphodiesterase
VRAKIWGCRGSLAAPGPDTVRYGGNTSCIEIRPADGSLVVLDAGTGLRNLGISLGGVMPPVVHLFLSHLHLDHLEGLGFFGPLWSPQVEFHVWGPASPTRSLEERIARYLSPPLFPVHLSEVPSIPIFHDVPDGEVEIGGARIVGEPISHQGPTVGYRISENGRTLAYLPDHEPVRGGNLREIDPAWISGHALAKGADALLHDSQYFEDEYRQKVGWGHSSIDQVVTFGRIAGVERLLLFHHDPLHTDERLESKLALAKELWGDARGGPELAREGMEIDLG